MSTRPDEADDADRAEQQRSALPDDDNDDLPTPATTSLDEADEADALEQGTEVRQDDDEWER